MSLFHLHLSERTVRQLIAAGFNLPAGENPDAAIIAALRELIGKEGADAGSDDKTNEPGNLFVDAVMKRLDELPASSVLSTLSLASRVAHDLGWDEAKTKRRLGLLAHTRRDLATQDGPEYNMYGNVVRGWRWHGRKPE